MLKSSAVPLITMAVTSFRCVLGFRLGVDLGDFVDLLAPCRGVEGAATTSTGVSRRPLSTGKGCSPPTGVSGCALPGGGIALLFTPTRVDIVRRHSQRAHSAMHVSQNLASACVIVSSPSTSPVRAAAPECPAVRGAPLSDVSLGASVWSVTSPARDCVSSIMMGYYHLPWRAMWHESDVTAAGEGLTTPEQ